MKIYHEFPSGIMIWGFMTEKVVHSWDELQDALYANSWREDIERFRSPYVFRGMVYADDCLETDLIRMGGNYADMEQHLLRNFRKYAHRNFVERDTLWHWMTLAQHHGLPTRLLDWTVSPLVAAHFTTVDINSYDRDRAIWMVNYQKAHHRQPVCFILGDARPARYPGLLARRAAGRERTLQDHYPG